MSVLDRKTLVLNKGWQPVHISSVRDAIVLLVKGAAKAVCPETFQTYDFDDWLMVPPNGSGYLRTVRMKISVPEVLVLIDYDKIPITNNFSKRNVFKRDKFVCQYCGLQTRNPTIDHVIPKARNGQSCWDNVVTACESCNKKKADKSLEDSGMKLRRVPGMPNFNTAQLIRKSVRNNPVWKKFI